MNLFDRHVKPGFPDMPSILVAVGYDSNGRIDKYGTVPAVPGTIIERCGKRYMLHKDGSQRRMS